MIGELKKGGTTIVLTTQYLEEAEQLADHIAILHQGYMIVSDTLERLKQKTPAPKVVYEEKQLSLEDIYMALTGGKE